MKDLKFNKVVIIGVGLIGGSIGIAMRKKHMAKEVVGVSRHSYSIAKAKKLGAIDRTPVNLKDAVCGSDLIIIATPISNIIPYIKKIRHFLKDGAIITDVGSTKEYLGKTIERVLPRKVYYVGTHPMAGSHMRGVSVARANLFENSVCILTKTKNTNKDAFRKIANLWNGLGADVKVMSPSLHDELVAMISHLPHIVAASLVESVRPQALTLAASGFKDTTRVANSDPLMWRDVCMSNKRYILDALKNFSACLDRFRQAVDNGYGDRLLSMLRRSQRRRGTLN